MVISWIEIDPARKLKNPHLFPAANIFLQSFRHRVFLALVLPNSPSFVYQFRADIKVGRHTNLHTTLCVAIVSG